MDRKKIYNRDDEKLKEFGSKVREIRENKNVSMQELADLCDMEYSQISRIERGLINTSISNLYAIAETLKVSPKEFFENYNDE